MAAYMVSWKAGRLSTAVRKVVMLTSISSVLTAWNFSSSYSPRTKALTARMAVRHSCTTVFRWSMACCRRAYRGAIRRTMKNRMTPSTGAQTKKTAARLGLI